MIKSFLKIISSKEHKVIFVLGVILLFLFALVSVTLKGEHLNSFWSNLLASSIVAIFFGLFLVKLTNLLKKPSLELFSKQGGVMNKRIIASKDKDGKYSFETSFSIKNNGDIPFKAGVGYWHIYVMGDNLEFKSSVPPVDNTHHIRNEIKLLVLPNSFTDIDILLQASFKEENKESVKIHWFFSTEYGYFPNLIQVDQQTGQVKYEHMGTIPVVLIDEIKSHKES